MRISSRAMALLLAGCLIQEPLINAGAVLRAAPNPCGGAAGVRSNTGIFHASAAAVQRRIFAESSARLLRSESALSFVDTLKTLDTGSVLHFTTRTIRRLIQHPGVLQDTLHSYLAFGVGWAAYYWTGDPHAFLITGADFIVYSLSRVLNTTTGFTKTPREQSLLILAGIPAVVFGIGILINPGASMTAFYTFAALNGLLMGQASLVRQRARLEHLPKTNGADAQGHHVVSEQSAGARWFGALMAAIVFVKWVAGSPEILILQNNPLESHRLLGLWIAGAGILYAMAGNRLLRVLKTKPELAVPAATEPPITLLFKPEYKTFSRSLAQLFVNTLLFPMPLAIPLLIHRLLGLDLAHTPAHALGLMLALWGGSRINMRLQERDPEAVFKL